MGYRYKGEPVTTKKGLLIINGKIVDLPLADFVARSCGFEYAERMVKALEMENGDNDGKES